MRIGLSPAVIELGLSGRPLDGVGVCTRAMLEQLGKAGCDVLPWSFPALRGNQAGRRVVVSGGDNAACDGLPPSPACCYPAGEVCKGVEWRSGY